MQGHEVTHTQGSNLLGQQHHHAHSQLGILMDVHSVLLPGNCVVDTVSFLGRVRVDNLLKDHS